MSQGQKALDTWKDLATRNTHVKYQHPSSYHLKVIAKVKVFNKKVKHHGQGQKVKNVCTYENILSQGILVWNINILVHTIWKL
jgi:hypothetical protein